MKHKVFKWREPDAGGLAKALHDRCADNVKRWAAKQGNDVIGRITGVQRSRAGIYSFDIHGRTQADLARWKAAWTKAYGDRSMTDALKKAGANGTFLHGYIYGFGMTVEINSQSPQLDVEVFVELGSNMPPEILRCVKSTYNELVEQFGEPA